MPQNIQIIKVTNDDELKTCFDIRKKVFVEEQKVPRELEFDEFEKESIHFLAYVNHPSLKEGA